MRRIWLTLAVALNLAAMPAAAQSLYEDGTEAYDNGDHADAARIFRRACDGGEALACTFLGYMLERGEGVEQDEAGAGALYAQACGMAEVSGCYNLGVLTEQGRGVAKDERRAAALYEQACDGGDIGGCYNLGVLFAQGRGVASNQARAARRSRIAVHATRPNRSSAATWGRSTRMAAAGGATPGA